MRGGPYAAIALAVVSVSFASIFITWSSSPPITIALYRLAIAAGIIGVTILLRTSAFRKPNTLLGISRRDAAVMALIGAILATHFALWISSLKVEGESIASSVVLVTSHPLLVGLLSHYVLRERRPTRSGWDVTRTTRSEEHTSELQSPCNLVCRLLLEKKKKCTLVDASLHLLYDLGLDGTAPRGRLATEQFRARRRPARAQFGTAGPGDRAADRGTLAG